MTEANISNNSKFQSVLDGLNIIQHDQNVENTNMTDQCNNTMSSVIHNNSLPINDSKDVSHHSSMDQKPSFLQQTMPEQKHIISKNNYDGDKFCVPSLNYQTPSQYQQAKQQQEKPQIQTFDKEKVQLKQNETTKFVVQKQFKEDNKNTSLQSQEQSNTFSDAQKQLSQGQNSQLSQKSTKLNQSLENRQLQTNSDHPSYAPSEKMNLNDISLPQIEQEEPIQNLESEKPAQISTKSKQESYISDLNEKENNSSALKQQKDQEELMNTIKNYENEKLLKEEENKKLILDIFTLTDQLRQKDAKIAQIEINQELKEQQIQQTYNELIADKQREIEELKEKIEALKSETVPQEVFKAPSVKSSHLNVSQMSKRSESPSLISPNTATKIKSTGKQKSIRSSMISGDKPDNSVKSSDKRLKKYTEEKSSQCETSLYEVQIQQARLSRLTSSNIRLEQQIKQQQDQISKYEQEYAELQKQKDQIDDELGKERNIKHQLEEQLQETQQELKIEKQQIQEFKDEVQSKNQQIDKLKQNILEEENKFNNTVEQYNQQLASWRSNNGALMNILKIFKEQIQMLSQHLSAVRKMVSFEQDKQNMKIVDDLVFPEFIKLAKRFNYQQNVLYKLEEKLNEDQKEAVKTEEALMKEIGVLKANLSKEKEEKQQIQAELDKKSNILTQLNTQSTQYKIALEQTAKTLTQAGIIHDPREDPISFLQKSVSKLVSERDILRAEAASADVEKMAVESAQKQITHLRNEIERLSSPM